MNPPAERFRVVVFREREGGVPGCLGGLSYPIVSDVGGGSWSEDIVHV